MCLSISLLLEISTYKTGCHIKYQGKYDQYGRYSEGHLKLSLLLCIYVKGYGKRGSGTLESLDGSVKGMGKACGEKQGC